MNREAEFLAATGEMAGVSAAEVAERWESSADDDGLSLLDRAAEIAALTADRRKIRILARVAAQAISGDDAKIHQASVLLPTLADLEPPHIRVVVELARKRSIGESTARSVEQISATLTNDRPDLVEVLVAQLVARGVLQLEQPVASIVPILSYQLTEMGRQLLEYLDEYRE